MRQLIFTFLLMASGLLAANAQLTNGYLEDWQTRQWSVAGPGSGNTYDEPGLDSVRTNEFIRTLNALNDLSSPLTIPLSCWETDTSYGGVSAARIKSQQFGPYFIPGFLGTGDVDVASQTLYLGRQYTTRPNSFSTWYKYAPVGADSAAFQVIFTLYDALTLVSNTIGYGSAVIYSDTSNWTNLQFNIAWSDTASPDTIILIATSSAGIDLNNFLASAGGIGSQLWIDDMTLQAGFASTDQEYINNNVSIYPNPSSDFINISMANMPNGLKLFVYDMNGKQMMAKVMNGDNYMLDISTLPNGVYGVVIQDNYNLMHRSRIIKK